MIIKCETPYSNFDSRAVCAVDGQSRHTSYSNMVELKCNQRNDVTLKLKHKGMCWEWEKHGIETYEVLLILIFFVLLVVGACWGICRVKRAMWKRNKPFSNVSP